MFPADYQDTGRSAPFCNYISQTIAQQGAGASVLDDIPGGGPARRKDLMRCFENIDAIRNATVEELKELPSMNEKSAQEVYKFFHQNH